jgi:NAD(P)-dependent dehydrogenase (short-subunit alcohol dehydrogenase family)
VTILVNNAAITRDQLLMRLKDEEWDAVIDTNLRGVMRTTRACLRGMLKARFGRIINISSVVGYSGNPGRPIMLPPRPVLPGSPVRWPTKWAVGASRPMSLPPVSSIPT